MAPRTLTAEELTEAREMIAHDIGSTGEWRSRVQEDYPEDGKNTEAADILEKLEASVAAIPDELITRYMALWQNEYPDEVDPQYYLTEDWSRRTREVGFGAMPSSAQELVEGFVEEWEAKLAPPPAAEPKPRRRAIRS